MGSHSPCLKLVQLELKGQNVNIVTSGPDGENGVVDISAAIKIILNTKTIDMRIHLV